MERKKEGNEGQVHIGRENTGWEDGGRGKGKRMSAGSGGKERKEGWMEGRKGLKKIGRLLLRLVMMFVFLFLLFLF